jgi:hypothetical protein
MLARDIDHDLATIQAAKLMPMSIVCPQTHQFDPPAEGGARRSHVSERSWRRSCASMATGACLCVALSTGSMAAQGSSRLQEEQDCPPFGQGAIAGPRQGPCFKVEERLRVDPQSRRGLSPWELPPSMLTGADEDGPMPAHLRLNGGYGGRPRNHR